MRWLVTLQVALGLGVLFGLAYQSVDGVVGPVTSAYAESAAHAEARAAATNVSLAWQQALGAQEQVVRNLGETRAFSTLGATFGRSGRVRGLTLALEAVVAEAGGQGRAAVLGPDAAPIVAADDAPLLAGTNAAQAALLGASTVRLELIEGQPHVVAAAPLRDKGKETVIGVLVLATPVDVPRLRSWGRSLPTGTLVALSLDGKNIVDTARPDALSAVVGPEATIKVLDEVHAVARRAGMGGDTVEVLGFAPVRGEGARIAVQQVELLVMVLGGLAFLLVSLLLMVAPAGAPAPALAPVVEAVPAPAAPLPSAQAPVALNFPSVPAPPPAMGTGEVAGVLPPREGAPSLQQAYANKTVPAHPSPAPAIPVPAVESVSPVNKSQDFQAPVGGERSPFAGAPAPVPQPAPVAPPVLADPPRTSAIMTKPAPVAPAPAPMAPPPAPVFSAVRTPPATSPFDAIASAAVSRPPHAPSPSATPGGLVDSKEDLPAPKGGVPPEMMAAHRAQQQRAEHSRGPQSGLSVPAGMGSTPYDPELPAPKGPAGPRFPGSESPRAPAPATEPPRQPPGATEPPQAAIPLPGSAPARNPWENPSVPAMKAPGFNEPRPNTQYPVNMPTSPPSSSVPAVSAAAGIEPYDETHYRAVYNEFVSSKAELGEAVDNITYEGFRTKLKTSEQQLVGRHSCRAVRFQVLVKDRTVSLRPQLVR